MVRRCLPCLPCRSTTRPLSSKAFARRTKSWARRWISTTCSRRSPGRQGPGPWIVFFFLFGGFFFVVPRWTRPRIFFLDLCLYWNIGVSVLFLLILGVISDVFQTNAPKSDLNWSFIFCLKHHWAPDILTYPDPFQNLGVRSLAGLESWMAGCSQWA